MHRILRIRLLSASTLLSAGLFIGMFGCNPADGPYPDWQFPNDCSEADSDGDGVSCMEGDCDDDDASVHPDAGEVCNGVDDNCNEVVDEEALDALLWFIDEDGDGFGTDAESVESCEALEGYTDNADDCDDMRDDVYPDAPELCDDLDNDCANGVDDHLPTWYLDGDGDGHAIADGSVQACGNGPDFTADPESLDDCDDGNALVYPGAPERCNDLDDDCDGAINEDLDDDWYVDGDADGFGSDNADPLTDCAAPEGYADNNEDCDDSSSDINPEAEEVCNGQDDNCDGATDDGVVKVYFLDRDGDGFGVDETAVTGCTLPGGYTEDPGDCDDTDEDINPSAEEICNDLDDDCDGQPDQYVDEDDGVIAVCE